MFPVNDKAKLYKLEISLISNSIYIPSPHPLIDGFLRMDSTKFLSFMKPSG
jgi:hypothetical protein